MGAYAEPTSVLTGANWVTAANAGNVYAFVRNSNTEMNFRTMRLNADTELAYSEIQGGNTTTGTYFQITINYQV